MAELDIKDLTGIYRSFETNEDVYASDVSGKLSSQGTSVDPQYLKEVLKLLFPQSAGAFVSSRVFWNKFKQLGTSQRNDQSNSAEKKLAKLIRVYYCGPGKNSSLESEISNWYAKSAKRPSAYKFRISGQNEYVEKNSIREMIGSDQDFKSEIMMVVVDAPALDLKKRNANKVEFFINYMPPVMMSQAVPYLDIKFIGRKKTKILDKGQNRGEAYLNFLSPLKFLSSTGNFDNNTANSLIYNGYTKFVRESQSSQNQQPGEVSVNQQTVTGIEMFTMPQTLVNMDYDQERNPRYNPVINPTAPFGNIESATITSVPSYSVYSFKTAALALKIFDRSRLVEISEILNPELYSSTSVILTYGWRAPIQGGDKFSFENKYHNFINENLLVSEVYGIRNSSISFEGSGGVSLTLDLFTKGAAELREVNPNGESISFKNRQNQVMKQFEQLKDLAKKLNLTTVVQSESMKDIRGSVLIGAALGGGYPELDSEEVVKEIKRLEGVLSGKDGKTINSTAKKLINLLNDLYKPAPKGSKQKFDRQLEEDKNARKIIQERLKPLTKNRPDVFSYIPGRDKQEKDDSEVGAKKHPLVELRGTLTKGRLDPKIYDSYNNYKSDKNDKDPIVGYGSFGEISFGRVFFTYFSSAYGSLQNSDSSPVAEEYQVFFYNLNNNAGPVANLNIAEFPIDMKKLEDAYVRRIIEQKGENMSMAQFLEIIRDSQFGDVRHPAFGFSDLYELKDGELVLRDAITKDSNGNTIETADSEFLKRTLNANPGTGESFVQPVVDFYIECGYETSETSRDLLTLYENASSEKIYGQKQGIKKIIKIHIYDKAATSHELATSILKSNYEGGYIKRTGKYKQTGLQANQTRPEGPTLEAANKAPDQKTLKSSLETVNANLESNKSDVRYEFLTFKDANGNPRIDLVKNEISRLVPTILVGNENSMISRMSFSTNQDSSLSTIMMLRNRQENKDPTQVNGAGVGDLPMSVIPGSLSMTIMGCPIVEYMQQFFVDMNTGTSIDNLYNVIGVTHSIGFGRYTTDLKFGFYDAYGKYRSPQEFINDNVAFVQTIVDAASQQRDQTSDPGKKKKFK